MELTAEEKAIILKIANQNGCDRDGDTLSFYVQEDCEVVRVVYNHIISSGSYKRSLREAVHKKWTDAFKIINSRRKNK